MRVKQFIKVSICHLFGHKPIHYEWVQWKKRTHVRRCFLECKRCGRKL